MVICHSNLLGKIFSVLSRQAGPILFLVRRNSFSLKMFHDSHMCGFWFSNSSVSFHRTISSPTLACVWDGARAGHMKPSKGNQSQVPFLWSQQSTRRGSPIYSRRQNEIVAGNSGKDSCCPLLAWVLRDENLDVCIPSLSLRKEPHCTSWANIQGKTGDILEAISFPRLSFKWQYLFHVFIQLQLEPLAMEARLTTQDGCVD